MLYAIAKGQIKIKRTVTTHAGVNGSSNGGGGEKRPNGSDAGNMSLTGGGPGSGTASRTGGSSGSGRGSHTATGGISGGSSGGNSTAGSLCSSVPDAKRFLRLCTAAQCKHSDVNKRTFHSEAKVTQTLMLQLVKVILTLEVKCL